MKSTNRISLLWGFFLLVFLFLLSLWGFLTYRPEKGILIEAERAFFNKNYRKATVLFQDYLGVKGEVTLIRKRIGECYYNLYQETQDPIFGEHAVLNYRLYLDHPGKLVDLRVYSRIGEITFSQGRLTEAKHFFVLFFKARGYLWLFNKELFVPEKKIWSASREGEISSIEGKLLIFFQISLYEKNWEVSRRIIDYFEKNNHHYSPSAQETLKIYQSQLLFLVNRGEEYRDLLLGILRKNPTHESALFQLGQWYQSSMDFENSRYYLEKFLNLNPTSNPGQSALASNFALQKNWEETLKILEWKPQNKRTWEDFYLQGMAHEKLAQPQKAREAYLMALEKTRTLSYHKAVDKIQFRLNQIK